MEPPAELIGGQLATMLLADSPGFVIGQPFAHPGQLCRGAGDIKDAILDDVGVDPLGRAHADDLVDGLLHV